MPCLGQSCQIYYFKNQIGYRTNVSARYTADEPIIPLQYLYAKLGELVYNVYGKDGGITC